MALCKWLSIATELISEFFDEGAARVRRAVVQKFYRSVLKFQYTIPELCESGCGRVQAFGGAMGRRRESYNGSDVFSGCGTSFACSDLQVRAGCRPGGARAAGDGEQDLLRLPYQFWRAAQY